MPHTPIYALSLDFRGDRRKELDAELAKFRIKPHYVISSKAGNALFQPTTQATQTEIAIWGSHIKALRSFLDSGSEWTLILEDDARTNSLSGFVLPKLENITEFLENEMPEFNVIQFGFIPNSQRSGITGVLSRLSILVLGINRFDFLAKRQLVKSLGHLRYRRIRKAWTNILGIPVIPLFGLRLGTHAYLVNRESAKMICDLFEGRYILNNLRTIDQELLIRTRYFKVEESIRALRFNLNFLEQLQIDSDNKDKTTY